MPKQKHKEKINPSKLRLVGLIAFLFGFADAFLIYVVSSYFKEAFHTENVSAFYFIVFSVVLLALFHLHTAIRRLGKSLLLFLLLVSTIMTNAILILLEPSWITVLVLMIHMILANLIWVDLDIVLESFSEDRRSGRIRGFHLMIINTGWLLAPFISVTLLEWFGYQSIFFVGLLLYSVILIIALLSLRNVNHKFKEKITPRQILHKVRRKSDILRIYHISFAIEFFYAIMIVYAPLYLLKLGFDWRDIGIIFTVMLVPFVLIQYPLGLLADKRFGEKEMLILFLLIMGISTVFLPVISSRNVWVWAAAFFVTRVGAAGIDVLRDSYFYKRIGPGDVDIIAFFRTARPAANIFAALVVGLSLFFFSLQSVFFVIALVVASSLGSAFALVDNVSERETSGFRAQSEA